MNIAHAFEPISRSNQIKDWRVLFISLLTACLALIAIHAHAVEVDGFTEPYRTITVGSAEAGIVMKLHVREGEQVSAGQPLATLDDDVYVVLLAIAEKSMEAKGRLDSALAELQLRQERLAKFEALRQHGHARQEEVDLARAELEIAEGKVTSAREDLLIKRLEYDKYKAQLDRRTVRSPIDGVITDLHKEVGEFIAPNNPDLLTLVELNPLLATFSVMSEHGSPLREGQEVQIQFPGSGRRANGVIDFVAPITDAESGTVRVKVRIDNPENRYRSGERCLMQLPRGK